MKIQFTEEQLGRQWDYIEILNMQGLERFTLSNIPNGIVRIEGLNEHGKSVFVKSIQFICGKHRTDSAIKSLMRMEAPFSQIAIRQRNGNIIGAYIDNNSLFYFIKLSGSEDVQQYPIDPYPAEMRYHLGFYIDTEHDFILNVRDNEEPLAVVGTHNRLNNKMIEYALEDSDLNNRMINLKELIETIKLQIPMAQYDKDCLWTKINSLKVYDLLALENQIMKNESIILTYETLEDINDILRELENNTHSLLKLRNKSLSEETKSLCNSILEISELETIISDLDKTEVTYEKSIMSMISKQMEALSLQINRPSLNEIDVTTLSTIGEVSSLMAPLIDGSLDYTGDFLKLIKRYLEILSLEFTKPTLVTIDTYSLYKLHEISVTLREHLIESYKLELEVNALEGEKVENLKMLRTLELKYGKCNQCGNLLVRGELDGTITACHSA